MILAIAAASSFWPVPGTGPVMVEGTVFTWADPSPLPLAFALALPLTSPLASVAEGRTPFLAGSIFGNCASVITGGLAGVSSACTGFHFAQNVRATNNPKADIVHAWVQWRVVVAIIIISCCRNVLGPPGPVRTFQKACS